MFDFDYTYMTSKLDKDSYYNRKIVAVKVKIIGSKNIAVCHKKKTVHKYTT